MLMFDIGSVFFMLIFSQCIFSQPHIVLKNHRRLKEVFNYTNFYILAEFLNRKGVAKGLNPLFKREQSPSIF